ncbi:MAG: GNAT family N-acetyltransferase [Anaerolineales bacterium]|nr:GNAT family N-acetyltransferase [Anaerolineales bacterium]
MLHSLKPEQYQLIQPLFGEGNTTPLYCQGVMAGKYPGKILVDNPIQPRNALVVKDIWCHLIGDPDNAAFHKELKRDLAEKRLIGEDKRVLFFVDPSPDWLEILNKLVEDRQPIPMPRCLYAATPAQEFQTPAMPDGFRLHFIDEAIRDELDGELPGDVQKVLDLREDADVPDEMAFGFVAANGRSLAAWSVIDFIIGDVGEIRLVTEDAYRRRGLAFTTSTATIAYGLSRGLKQINWDAAASNLPSIRTAQKLGLQLLHEPKEYIIIFSEISYLINLAWSHLDTQRFEQVHIVAEQMVTSDEEMLVQYGQFLTAAAWAGLGDPVQAILHLRKAIEAGFDNLFEMEKSPHLKILHGSTAWEDLIGQMKSD